MGGHNIVAIGKGNPRKPAAIKRLEGQQNRCANPSEPRLEARKLPAPPEHCNETQRHAWTSLAAVIDPMRITTAQDVAAFTLMVQAYTICLEADAALWDTNKNPAGELTYEEETGTHALKTKKRPELDILAQYQKIVMYHFSRFGLTPADRSRVSALEDKSTKDQLDEFA